MRHQKRKKTLDRNRASRKALLRGLIISFVVHRKITTSKVRAKVLQSAVEKLVTLAKKNDLHARREILKHLGSRQDSQKTADVLLSDIQKKYQDRKGGYTRIVKLGARVGDASERVLIEFV